jgi:hypothetical protein
MKRTAGADVKRTFSIAAVDVAVGGIPRVRDDAGDIKCAADREKVITDRRQVAGIEISDPAQARIDG